MYTTPTDGGILIGLESYVHLFVSLIVISALLAHYVVKDRYEGRWLKGILIFVSGFLGLLPPLSFVFIVILAKLKQKKVAAH